MTSPFPPTLFDYFRWIIFQRDAEIRNLFLGSSLLIVGGMTTSVISTFQLKVLLDQIILDPDPFRPETVKSFFLFAVFMLLFHGCFRIHDFLERRFHPKLRGLVRLEALQHLLGHTTPFFHDRFAGSLGGKLFSLADSTVMAASLSIFFVLMPLSRFILFGGILIWTNIPMGVFFVVWFSVYFVILYSLTRRAALYSGEVATKAAENKGRLIDILTNIAAVRSYVREGYEFSSFRAQQEHELAAEDHQFRFFAFIWRFQSVGQIVSQIVIFGMALYALSQKSITPGDVLLIVTYSQTLMMMLWSVGWGLIEMNRNFGICQDALDLVATPHDMQDESSVRNDAEVASQSLPLSKVAVSFKSASFSYYHGQPVLKSISLEIPLGQKVGLVGYSGAGKSTLVSLLLGERKLSSGTIELFGEPLHSLPSNSLRKLITVVPQEPVLFHRTLRENIVYGAERTLAEGELMDALNTAQCIEFVKALPKGLDTIVGERGLKLSGGQRQRIVLARALLRDSPIIVLDEATSALDSETEEAIQMALQAVLAGRTALVIAHRLATLQQLERVLVLDDGEVTEDGTIEQLIEQNGLFAKLWRQQTGGFLPQEANERSSLHSAAL